jgi:hypothetical protein
MQITFTALVSAIYPERAPIKHIVRRDSSSTDPSADGLGILRAVQAAGVREAIGTDGHSLAISAVSSLWARVDVTKPVTAGHVLVVLQALAAGGLDVLARGPADKQSILHTAAQANAPELVRWLATDVGAPLEERGREDFTPLLVACFHGSWAAAHALLDCGARADVQSSNSTRWWPVLLAIRTVDCDFSLFKRIVAADRDCLSRCGADSTALHLAAIHNMRALTLLLGSGLPHLAEAVNKVMAMEGSRAAAVGATPLHYACTGSHWDAALALVAAGARVDIPGAMGLDCVVQTIAEWGRSAGCKHRGLKMAIAARARRQAAEARRDAVGDSDAFKAAVGTALSISRAEFASAPGATGTGAIDVGGAYAGAGAAHARKCESASPARPAGCGGKKEAKSRKRREIQARNQAEHAEAAEQTRVCSTAAVLAGPPLDAARGQARGAPPAATPIVSAEPHTCEDPGEAAAAIIAGCCNAPETCLELRALSLAEDPSAALVAKAADTPSALEPSCDTDSTADCASMARVAAADVHTCEPGAGCGGSRLSPQLSAR